jgi:hypothetical protein
VIRHSDESQQRVRRAAILEPGVLRPSICTRCPGNLAAGAADAARGDDADGVLDSGDYQASVDHAVEAGGLAELCRRRNQARAEGRFNGLTKMNFCQTFHRRAPMEMNIDAMLVRSA